MTYLGEGGIQDLRARVPREYGQVTLDSSGEASVTFQNFAPISAQRYIQLTPWIAAGTAPVVANPVQWASSGSNYTGFSIKGQRLRSLPSPLTLLSSLAGFQPWQDADGVVVHWMLY